MSTISPLVKCIDVSFGYISTFCLLKKISFQLFPGEVVLLAGGNGCGKSTLLELLTGRLRPDSGTVQVFGKDPAKLHRMPEIGIISEPFHRKYGPLPVDMCGWEIQQWLEILDGIAKEKFLEKMDSLAISKNMLKRKIESFSKGERQRFITGAVLLRQPKLLLADEPLEGLDVQSRLKIGEQMRVFADSGGTVFWISHHLNESLRFADRFFRLEEKTLREIPSNSYTVEIPNQETISMATLLQLPLTAEEYLAENDSLTLTIRKN